MVLPGRGAHQVRQRRAAAARQMDGPGEGKPREDNGFLFGSRCSLTPLCRRTHAGAGPADRLAGDRAGGAGAARGRPRLLLLERPLG